jgi:hypothetical protein
MRYVSGMTRAAAEVMGSVPRPPSNSVQVALRIPAEWISEADEIAKLISRPGFQAARADAFRAAMARGFEALRAEAKGKRK